MLDEIVLYPLELRQEMQHKTWNDEQFFAHHLSRRGLSDRIRSFPYVMYMARPAARPQSNLVAWKIRTRSGPLRKVPR